MSKNYMTLTIEVDGADPRYVAAHEIGEIIITEWLDWRMINEELSGIGSDIQFVDARWIP